MVTLNLLVNRLRKVSFFLFLIPTIALFLSIAVNNILISFHWNADTISLDNLPLSTKCNKQNNFCINTESNNSHRFGPLTTLFEDQIKIFDPNSKLSTCDGYSTYFYIMIDDQKLDVKKYKEKYFTKKKIKNEFINKDIKIFMDKSGKKNLNCIKNWNYYKIYKIFPFPYELINKIQLNPLYVPATSSITFPLLDGATSISNMVKRFPINLMFKPLLYITSILMLFYWIIYQKTFDKITGQKKIFKFSLFGIASSIFLFFHILLLGSEFDAYWFKTLRKLIIVLFILCELVAQSFLVRRIFMIKDLLQKYTHKIMINIKITFIITILTTTVIILLILSITNLSSNIDYILEWNYFLLLLIFYFLSFLMWKKNN